MQAQGHITLRGDDLQRTIHLVDYLMDLTYAPFNGRTPMKVLFEVMKQQFDGVGLLERIRVTPNAQLEALIKSVVNTHG